MAYSERNNFMMKYGRIEHVHQFIDDLAKGGSHYDNEAADHALNRLDTTPANGMYGKKYPSANSHVYQKALGKVFDAVHQHGSPNELVSFLDRHSDKFTADQLHKAWHEPQGGRDDVNGGVRHAVLGHQNVSASLLRHAMTTKDSFLRQTAVAHKNAPIDVLKMGAEDSADHVEKEAKARAKARGLKLK